MNTINIVETLKDVPVGQNRSITVAAMHIINAGILANDRKEAAAEAKRIYKQNNRAGMYMKVQRDARQFLEFCSKHGLTVAKPYKVEQGRVWVPTDNTFGGVDFMPL